MRRMSKYSYIFESGKYGYFIYNAVTNSFVKIGKDLKERIEQVAVWDEEALAQFPKDFQNVLFSHKIIVDEQEDEDYYVKKKYAKFCSAFNPNVLGLTVATTTGCNFACPYCYEKGAVAQVMGKEVEDAIVSHVESSTAKMLDVTWDGGEPLMNFDTIKRLSEAFSKISHLKKVKYSMISNGFFLDEDKANYLKQYELQSIQITVDGLAKTHNQSRCAKNGEPTYDRIIRNIDKCSQILTETTFGIRVNISKFNGEEYALLYRELSEKWKERKNISIYFAFVEDYGQCDVNCYSSSEKIDFIRELRTKYQIYSRGCYPYSKLSVCIANSAFNYVIAPNGDLYKCWSDIGKENRIVGSILTKKIMNYSLVANYAIAFDKYDDPKCKECFLFPICDGGCPGHRYNNVHCGHHHEVCPYELQNIDKILEMIYEDYITNVKSGNV